MCLQMFSKINKNINHESRYTVYVTNLHQLNVVESLVKKSEKFVHENEYFVKDKEVGL